MSYLDRTQAPRSRNTAVAGVIVIHALVGYALVTGLSFSKLIEDIANPETIFITDDPPLPPPEPMPTPTSEVDPVVTKPVTPETPFPLPKPDPGLTTDPFEETKIVEGTALGGGDDEIVRPLPDPPRPPAFPPRGARPRNDKARWITTDDYPRQPLMDHIEGTAGYRVAIGVNGRVTSCEIVNPSGNRALDAATCKHIAGRARFDPATDSTGAKVAGTYSGSVKWEIPD